MFLRVNKISVLAFNAIDNRKRHSRFYLPAVKVDDIMINGKKLFDQPNKNDIKSYDKIQKITTGQGDDYTAGCLLYYNCLIKHYKMIAIDLSKQQALDADSKAIQKINFMGNISSNNDMVMFFIIEEAKETVFDLS